MNNNNNNEILKAHKNSISASNANRLMTFQESEHLPQGAVNYVDSMCRFSDDDFLERYESPAMVWGIEQEPNAIRAILKEFGLPYDNLNFTQKRYHFGFASAMPDFVTELDGKPLIIEIKCLDTVNHDRVISECGDDAKALLRIGALDKYAQCQVQRLCVSHTLSMGFIDVDSIIVFYDPRSTVKKLHYIVVDYDQDFLDLFLKRLVQAKQLYDKTMATLSHSGVLFDATMPKTKQVSNVDIEITPVLLEAGIDEMVGVIAGHYGVTVKDGHFIGGDVFDCEKLAGRDAAKKAHNKITKFRNACVRLHKPITTSHYEKYKASLAVDQGIEQAINGILAHITAPLMNWNAEQERIALQQALELAEQERLSAEAAAKIKEAIEAKIRVLVVTQYDLLSIESIAAKRAIIESIFIDNMFGEFEQQARAAKIKGLGELDFAELGIKDRAIEAEKARLAREAELIEFGRQQEALRQQEVLEKYRVEAEAQEILQDIAAEINEDSIIAQVLQEDAAQHQDTILTELAGIKSLQDMYNPVSIMTDSLSHSLEVIDVEYSDIEDSTSDISSDMLEIFRLYDPFFYSRVANICERLPEVRRMNNGRLAKFLNEFGKDKKDLALKAAVTSLLKN